MVTDKIRYIKILYARQFSPGDTILTTVAADSFDAYFSVYQSVDTQIFTVFAFAPRDAHS